MSQQVFLLAAAAATWVALHLGVAGTALRRTIALRIGDGGFRGAFSVLSVGAIAWLSSSYAAAAGAPVLWIAPDWLMWAPFAIMPIALFLLIGAFTVRNPTAIGGEAALAGPEPAAGLLRITRHPMLWAFAIWAALHIAVNGDAASLLLFGAILVTSLGGMPSIDLKRARSNPDTWPRFAATTSVVPFVAILQGRNRLALNELPWWLFVAALALWAVLLGAHPHIFGVPAIPPH